ncbi:CPBP family intramembrane glutamic endopeptidase [Nocardia sp. NPDC088792]|uniref:CPBP family intramembrane glutamic endopeptidase n=1 Tax=Nocardia sp. NPDC088792 TaxID=3364332 RepID=UPI0038017E51
MRIRRWRRVYLAAEYAALFFGGTTAYNAYMRGKPPIPILLALAAGATVYLRRSDGFDRQSLWRPKALRPQARSMAVTAVSNGLALTAATALLRREDLFDLPRRNPWLWLAVMVLYPMLSVYPQELVFRSFLFHRYAPVFGDGAGLVAASAAAFGYVHIIFGSWVSVAASGVGGWIFAARYLTSQSLFTASVEHSVYGMLIFSIGLGRYFYHGAVPARGAIPQLPRAAR